MRIGILTLPLHTNYGGILQAYALQQVLEGMGHEAVVLDRYPYIDLSFLTKCIHYPYRLAKKMLFKAKYPIRYDKVHNDYVTTTRQYTNLFLRKYMQRIELRRGYSELKAGDFDAIVVGSDQVWRPMYFGSEIIADAYLSFAKDWDIRRVAYAPSFGTEDWEYTPEQTAECGALLHRFDAVSVRESSAVSLCKQHFDVDAQHVLDPTMLLDAEHYARLFHANGTPQSGGDLMCYVLDASEDKSALIRQVAEVYGLTPFAANSKCEDPNATLEEKVQPPVESWLRGFYDAKYVVTDSFHACVFSILFQKPFIVYGNKVRGMARFHSLLTMFGLEDRLVATPDEASAVIRRPIDWDAVHTRLTEWRQVSKEFLLTSLT